MVAAIDLRFAVVPPGTEITDEDVFEILETALGDFPNLKRVLPPTYPRGAKFEISLARMHEYAEARAADFWHQLNMPLVLHTYRANPDVNARQLMFSLLKAFDDFIDRCGDRPGSMGLLAPLWEDAWCPTPQLWSIASCCYLALCYERDKIEIIGFEQTIGAGPKVDDITVRLANKTTHVEVEAFHRAEFGACSDEELVRKLAHRADLKAAKFAGLTDQEVGVVAVVCVVKGADVERRLATPLTVSAIEGRAPNVGWMGCRLVGVRLPEGLRYSVMPL